MSKTRTSTGIRELLRIGPKPNVLQIVPPRSAMRPSVRRLSDHGDAHDLLIHPLAAPTGPGGAAGFRNRAGSTISRPEATNIYLGKFWDDRPLVEAFSQAIIENGYLDPLRELGYGTGSGVYLGAVDGPALKPDSTFSDADARRVIRELLDAGAIHGSANSLFMLILPDGIKSAMPSGDVSCQNYCGYHDALPYNGQDIAYAVLPSTLCAGCGGEIGDFTAVYAHEVAEACTDKVPGRGWVADDGQENGDLEAWILFGWGPPSDPNRYTIQGYYTNERGNTVGAWRQSAAAHSAVMRATAAATRRLPFVCTVKSESATDVVLSLNDFDVDMEPDGSTWSGKRSIEVGDSVKVDINVKGLAGTAWALDVSVDCDSGPAKILSKKGKVGKPQPDGRNSPWTADVPADVCTNS